MFTCCFVSCLHCGQKGVFVKIIIVLLLILAAILLAIAAIVTSLIRKTFVFLDQHR